MSAASYKLTASALAAALTNHRTRDCPALTRSKSALAYPRKIAWIRSKT